MIQYLGELIFPTWWYNDPIGNEERKRLKRYWSQKYYPIEDEL